MEVSPAPAFTPEAIHPALWRAAQLGRSALTVRPSGFAALDAQLPGGGWPCGALTELLLPHPGVGEWRLLAPALAGLQRAPEGPDEGPRGLMLFGPPARPCAWTLAALGLDLSQLLVVQGRGPATDLLWALEQALASGQLGAALAWLPARLPGDALRRLQMAAQAHPGPVFLFRERAAAARPSVAPLRLGLAPGAPDELQLQLLKRRGPPLAAPLVLALPPVLSPAARERALAPARPGRPGGPGHLPAGPAGATVPA